MWIESSLPRFIPSQPNQQHYRCDRDRDSPVEPKIRGDHIFALRSLPIEHVHTKESLCSRSVLQVGESRNSLKTYCDISTRQKEHCQNCNGFHSCAVALVRSCNLDIEFVVSLSQEVVDLSHRYQLSATHLLFPFLILPSGSVPGQSSADR